MTAHILGNTTRALERLDEAELLELSECSVPLSHMHRIRAFIALDDPEAGDPETLLEASIIATRSQGFHSRFAALYRAFPSARAGDTATVVHTVDKAFDLSLALGSPNAFSDTAIAAAELLETLDRLDDAAAIVAALYRQTFTFPELYHRYRQARSRLPSAPTPDRRLTASELHHIVRERLASLTGQPATIGTEPKLIRRTHRAPDPSTG
jgi:hypothetical protein